MKNFVAKGGILSENCARWQIFAQIKSGKEKIIIYEQTGSKKKYNCPIRHGWTPIWMKNRTKAVTCVLQTSISGAENIKTGYAMVNDCLIFCGSDGF